MAFSRLRLGPLRSGCVALAGATFAALGTGAGPPYADARPAGEHPAARVARHIDDQGVYTAYCAESSAGGAGSEASRAELLRGAPGAALLRGLPRASAAMASHAGWPPKECLKMDKGPAGESHTLRGARHLHNWLLGGYGDDTIWAGEEGDVIWGDYHPEGQSESERDYLHGGAGADWIYSSHGYNEIWTGAGNDHLALVYGHGVVFCDGPGVKTLVMRYLPQNRHFTLVGCAHKVLDRYRA